MNTSNTNIGKVPGAVPSSLHKLTHLTLITTLWEMKCQYSHFTDWETEALNS